MSNNATTTTDNSDVRRGPGRKPKSFAFYSFDEAKRIMQGMGLTSIKEWQAYLKSDGRDVRVPSNPNIVYKGDGWTGLPDFLGYEHSGRGRKLGGKNSPKTEVVAEDENLKPTVITGELDFEDARSMARAMNLKTRDEYRKADLPEGLPKSPDTKYRDQGWNGWKDFLGTAA